MQDEILELERQRPDIGYFLNHHHASSRAASVAEKIEEYSLAIRFYQRVLYMCKRIDDDIFDYLFEKQRHLNQEKIHYPPHLDKFREKMWDIEAEAKREIERLRRKEKRF